MISFWLFEGLDLRKHVDLGIKPSISSGSYIGGTWGTTFDPVFVVKWILKFSMMTVSTLNTLDTMPFYPVVIH